MIHCLVTQQVQVRKRPPKRSFVHRQKNKTKLVMTHLSTCLLSSLGLQRNAHRDTLLLFLHSITYYFIHFNVQMMICSSHDVFRSQWETGNSHLLTCNYNQCVFLCSTSVQLGKTEETWPAANFPKRNVNKMYLIYPASLFNAVGF